MINFTQSVKQNIEKLDFFQTTLEGTLVLHNKAGRDSLSSVFIIKQKMQVDGVFCDRSSVQPKQTCIH